MFWLCLFSNIRDSKPCSLDDVWDECGSSAKPPNLQWMLGPCKKSMESSDSSCSRCVLMFGLLCFIGYPLGRNSKKIIQWDPFFGGSNLMQMLLVSFRDFPLEFLSWLENSPFVLLGFCLRLPCLQCFVCFEGIWAFFFQNPGWLFYSEDHTTHIYGDCNKPI